MLLLYRESENSIENAEADKKYDYHREWDNSIENIMMDFCAKKKLKDN